MTRCRPTHADVVIVGGGFYGCCLALHWRQYTEAVVLVEQAEDLLTQASALNQARIHRGYHYPRSLLTAYRSGQNYGRFKAEFAACIVETFDHYYAVARQGSKVNSHQFARIAQTIEAPLSAAPEAVEKLFSPRLIEQVFRVEEYAFDANLLRAVLRERLEAAGVPVLFNTPIHRLTQSHAGGLLLESPALDPPLSARQVFHCTYANLNTLLQASNLPSLPLKLELAELALMQMPEALLNKAITVMDGPFFSCMPFPTQGLHSLSHVRYTPHRYWLPNTLPARPDTWLKDHPPTSAALYMQKDAARYLPLLSQAQHVRSLFTLKALLTHHETDDGRPILLHRHEQLPGLWSVLGGKIDNIYDILEHLPADGTHP